MNLIRLPWFRVHVVTLNNPGRLISVHIMHTGLAGGWSGCMVFYELIIVDATDPVYNPVWRQGSYVIPFMCRLGVSRSLYSWALGMKLSINLHWTYETVDIGHITLSGFCVLAGFWHWSYWDLDLFVSYRTGQLVLDLNTILGIHLCIASIACFGFGLGHQCGFYGPGIWTSDSFGVLGSIRLIKPIYSVIGLAPFCYGVISSNHIVAGLLGSWIGLWHMSSRPGKAIYKLLNMGNVEEVLCSSIGAVFFIALLISGAMWYGCLSAATELYGPSRYQWDNGYFCVDIERRVKSAGSMITASNPSDTADVTIGGDVNNTAFDMLDGSNNAPTPTHQMPIMQQMVWVQIIWVLMLWVLMLHQLHQMPQIMVYLGQSCLLWKPFLGNRCQIS